MTNEKIRISDEKYSKNLTYSVVGKFCATKIKQMYEIHNL